MQKNQMKLVSMPTLRNIPKYKDNLYLTVFKLGTIHFDPQIFSLIPVCRRSALSPATFLFASEERCVHFRRTSPSVLWALPTVLTAAVTAAQAAFFDFHVTLNQKNVTRLPRERDTVVE